MLVPCGHRRPWARTFGLGGYAHLPDADRTGWPLLTSSGNAGRLGLLCVVPMFLGYICFFWDGLYGSDVLVRPPRYADRKPVGRGGAWPGLVRRTLARLGDRLWTVVDCACWEFDPWP